MKRESGSIQHQLCLRTVPGPGIKWTYQLPLILWKSIFRSTFCPMTVTVSEPCASSPWITTSPSSAAAAFEARSPIPARVPGLDPRTDHVCL